MSHGKSRAERLQQIESLLLAHPEGYTQAELARKINVNRSTISRMLPDLTFMYNVTEYVVGKSTKLQIPASHRLREIVFTRSEAVFILLSMRLCILHMDRKNPQAASAIRKLARAIQPNGSNFSEHLVASASTLDYIAQESNDLKYFEVLRTLVDAWIEQKQVEVQHFDQKTERVYTYTFCPYAIEPYPAGHTLHVIGFRVPPHEIKTFKLERIESVKILNESYEIPKQFQMHELLSDAWGIWYTQSDPIEVVLRFHPRVARRVQENQWHTSQHIQKDGEHILWTAHIAEPKEMLPWIRGWGSDCEVLQPQSLREQLIQEVELLYQIYRTPKNTKQKEQLTNSTYDPQVMYAHSPNDEGLWHTYDAHAGRVAQLASEFAKVIDASEAASALGWWHDAGKLHPKWQEYLYQNAQKTWTSGKKGPVHAIVGGVSLCKQSEHLLPLSMSILSHHTGLKDQSTFKENLLAGLKDDYVLEASQYAHTYIQQHSPIADIQIPKYLVAPSKGNSCARSLPMRMLHSCLVDADCLDTEAHFDPYAPQVRSDFAPLEQLWERFEQNHNELLTRPTTELNERRNMMYQDALRASSLRPGFFSLTIPTGGGKTRTSMAFALKHAQQYGHKRIIVAIPYTSIIDQNADEYRSIFGEDAVLEHHSSRDIKHSNAGIYERKQRMASQNWDAPIIATTNVQLFESLFANRNGRLRKLHNIAHSILILDEVQTLPTHLLAPTLDALRYLVEHFKCTIVFCTATQPAFDEKTIGHLPQITALSSIREIVEHPEQHFQALERVQYHFPTKRWERSTWAQQISKHAQVLAICNTVDDAQLLFQSLSEHLHDEDSLFHLSTRLCGAHRRQVMHTVKARLSQGEPCILISTQVVEAGVDLDFPIVFRAIAPLDSIIQAAGRCNREGKLDCGHVYIVDGVENTLPPGVYTTATTLTRQLLPTIQPRELNHADVCKRYFGGLYGTQNTDREGIQTFEERMQFEQSAKHYKLIDSDTVAVCIPFEEQGHTTIQRIRSELPHTQTLLRRHMRALQPFTIQLFQKHFEQAVEEGLVHEITEGLYEWIGEYDAQLGIRFQPAQHTLIH